MSVITSWLSGIKLTFAQWVGASAALVIGLLVAALKLQGTKLHAAQVALLKSQFGRTMDQHDDKVESARAAYLKALDVYEDSRE